MKEKLDPEEDFESLDSIVQAVVLADELNTKETEPQQIEVIDEAENLFFVKMKDYEDTSLFTPKPIDVDDPEGQSTFPLKGRGKLDNFLVISKDRDYNVEVTVDGKEIVKDSYENLADISSELTHVSAYQTNSNFIVSVTDYPFKELLDIKIRPMERITFPLIRVEGVLE